ncbi:MAG: DUF695 domain-containing protein [Kineosporiaceae bacterium]|nr:DUF695 domain-containing protein [Kineosporiaceae bacterium]
MTHMPLFRRPRRRTAEPAPVNEAVIGFWRWWDQHADEVAGALSNGHSHAVEGMVGPQVARIHPDLAWEVGAGREAAYLLVVSSDGSPELRTLAERWRRAGPPDGAVWQFRPARQRDRTAFRPGNEITAGGRAVELSTIVAQATPDDRRCRLDVSIYHPRFFEMPEQARVHLSFMVLDWALGEDDVERWLGAVEAVTVEPIDPFPVARLAEVVQQAAQGWSGDRWALMEGWHGDRRLLAAIRHPLHRVDHPLFDQHVEIRLPYRDLLPDGLPGEQAVVDLKAFQDSVTERLGASALLVGHETSSGERLMHLYGDSTASVVPLIEAMLGAYSAGSGSVRGEPDPSWHAVEHLRPQ